MSHLSPYVVELFPCSGGMAEGLRRAGIKVSVAFDCDADACRSYTVNLGHAPVRIDVRDLVRMARDGWRPPREGFPPGWVFHGATKRARWAQIGMAMPPPLAEAVGRSILAAIVARDILDSAEAAE